MLTARNIFEQVEGREFTYVGLRRELQQICAANLEKLPPELNTQQLFAVATRNHWLKQNAKGIITINFHRPRGSSRARSAAAR